MRCLGYREVSSVEACSRETEPPGQFESHHCHHSILTEFEWDNHSDRFDRPGLIVRYHGLACDLSLALWFEMAHIAVAFGHSD